MWHPTSLWSRPIFLVQDLNRNTTHSGVQSHSLQVMDITFQIPATLVLTTELSAIGSVRLTSNSCTGVMWNRWLLLTPWNIVRHSSQSEVSVDLVRVLLYVLWVPALNNIQLSHKKGTKWSTTQKRRQYQLATIFTASMRRIVIFILSSQLVSLPLQS